MILHHPHSTYGRWGLHSSRDVPSQFFLVERKPKEPSGSNCNSRYQRSYLTLEYFSNQNTLVYQIIVQDGVNMQDGKISKIDKSAGWNNAVQVEIFQK